MELEKAFEIIFNHYGDVGYITSRITDKEVIKRLLRFDFFEDMVIEFYAENPDAPGSSLYMEALEEVTKERAKRSPVSERLYARVRKIVDNSREARRKYLFSFVSDPLASFVIRKLRLNPVKNALIGLGFVFVTYLAGFLLHLLTGQEVAGITKTWVDILYDFLLVPVVFGYYVWISPRAGWTFLEMKDRGVELSGGKDYTDTVAGYVNDIVNHRFWVRASAMVTLGLIAITYITFFRGETIWGPGEASPYIFLFWKVPVVWGLSWYMVMMVFSKEIAMVYSVRKLVRSGRLVLNFSHPDRQGGLKPIYDYAKNFSYFITAIGFGFALLYFRGFRYEYIYRDVMVNAGFLVYLGLACFFFFSPLSPVQKVVKGYREEAVKMAMLPPLRPATVLSFFAITFLPIIFLLISPVVKGI